VSLSELKKRAGHIYNILGNSQKKQEALDMVGTLKRDLEAWAIWQEEQLNEKKAA
jgi:hypothetical protein